MRQGRGRKDGRVYGDLPVGTGGVGGEQQKDAVVGSMMRHRKTGGVVVEYTDQDGTRKEQCFTTQAQAKRFYLAQALRGGQPSTRPA
jgi:hypothetical protein